MPCSLFKILKLTITGDFCAKFLIYANMSIRCYIFQWLFLMYVRVITWSDDVLLRTSIAYSMYNEMPLFTVKPGEKVIGG
jgi:hypothetical protein